VKLRLALLVVVAQVAVVAFIAAQREWIARTGTTITLRTAPIDPHDPMRGEFVRFRYGINTVPARLFRGGLAAWPKLTDYRAQRRLRDTVVYASLRADEHGFAQVIALSDEQPSEGIFLRGRVGYVAESGGIQSVQVRYGVESLYLQQGAARAIEDLARGERRGVPIDTTIAVGGSGLGVLRSFAWEPLGLTVTPDRPPAPPQGQTRAARAPSPLAGITGVTVELKNFGNRDVAIVDLPDGQSFRLQADAENDPEGYRWVGAARRPSAATVGDARLIVLKPGEAHRVHLNLADPAWWVEGGPGHEPATPLAEVRERWRARFRIEYAPPSPEQLRGRPHAELVRHVPLTSRLFTGGID